MKLLHFSDLHIGVENYGRTDTDTGLSTRLLHFLASLDEVVDYALTQDVDLYTTLDSRKVSTCPRRRVNF